MRVWPERIAEAANNRSFPNLFWGHSLRLPWNSGFCFSKIWTSHITLWVCNRHDLFTSVSHAALISLLLSDIFSAHVFFQKSFFWSIFPPSNALAALAYLCELRKVLLMLERMVLEPISDLGGEMPRPTPDTFCISCLGCCYYIACNLIPLFSVSVLFPSVILAITYCCCTDCRKWVLTLEIHQRGSVSIEDIK